MQKTIKKESLENLIEPLFKENLIEEKYDIKTIEANKLLVPTRFDFAFKLLYLDMIDKNVDFAKKIYKEHIRAFSLGKFIEPGNEEKNSIEKYEKEFLNIFKNIQKNGFDNTKTLIPLSIDGIPLNGAHRISSAIYLNKKVECVSINRKTDIYDYKFFYNRNISNDILDIAATKFVEYAENIYIAFIWPTAIGHDEEIENIIPHRIYKKEVKLNQNGAHNLLSQIYAGEKWVGNINNDFKGVQGKLIECFKNFNPVRIIAFQADNLNEVLKIKDRVREIFKVGKHSIHITDTKEEAIKMAQIVFNDNAIHFLNYAKPTKYKEIYSKLENFKKFIIENNIDKNDIIISSDFILSLYGLRKSQDIDFLTTKKVIKKYKDINSHDKELKYYDLPKNELIYNPQNYFYFEDLKFISFNLLYKMKKNRDEEKDRNDCKIMNALVEKNRIKQLISRWKQNLYYFKIKAENNFLLFLKKAKLYNIVRAIYRRIKGKK